MHEDNFDGQNEREPTRSVTAPGAFVTVRFLFSQGGRKWKTKQYSFVSLIHACWFFSSQTGVEYG